MMRNALLSVHLLAVIVWIGVGFFELYLGRRFLASRGTPVEAPLMRIVNTSDAVVAVATMTAFVAGIAMALYEGYGFFHQPALAGRQASDHDRGRAGGDRHRSDGNEVERGDQRLAARTRAGDRRGPRILPEAGTLVLAD
jgi:hypothetical protein